MRAEIVSIGTELLLGQIVDSNAAYLGGALAEIGVSCTHRQTVGDNLERVVEALQLALSRSDIVLTIGGLGPTQDDLTRDAIAIALGSPLVLDPELEAHLRQIFEARKFAWVDSQLRQAMRPDCARPLENPNGTAPGLLAELDDKVVIAFPGPPSELIPMYANLVRPYLVRKSGTGVIHSRTVRTCGIGEGVLADQLKDLLELSDPTVAPYAKPAEVHLRVTTRAATVEEAEARIAPILQDIQDRLGDKVYSIHDLSLEEVALDLLRSRNKSLVVAESCTGGGLGARLTSVPGSSDVFFGGAITYINLLKEELLGVQESTLETVGAVSEECAREMAEGAKSRMRADWGVSITGIAGPGGGSEEKPVGLVFIGISGPNGTTVERNQFRGSREQIRLRSVQAALVQLRARLLQD